jgi:hypothetical protein
VETKQQETVRVGEKNYIVDDLSEKSKYMLAQLQDLDQQLRTHQAKAHQCDVAIGGFQLLFEESVNEKPEEREHLEGELSSIVT